MIRNSISKKSLDLVDEDSQPLKSYTHGFYRLNRTVQLKIRRIKRDDIPKVVELKKSSMGPVWDEADISYDERSLRKFLQHRIVNDRMIAAFTDENEEGEKILGFLHSTTFKDVVSSNKVREILTIVIHPDHFGQGIARELMENERMDAKEDEVDIMKLETLSENERALEFYKKQEFEEKKKVMTRELDD